MIRAATPADIPAIVELGRRMASESPRWRAMPYRSDKVAAMAERLIEQGSAFLALRGDEVVGMIGGAIYSHWFTDVECVGAMALYVVPEHRGGRDVVRLIRALEAWGRARGAVECAMGVHTGSEQARTGQLFRQLGYVDAGQDFMLPLISGA